MIRLLFPLLALNLLFCASQAEARTMTRDEYREYNLSRVDNATHVFEGITRKITVLDKNGEVKPEPEKLTAGTYARLEIEVAEVYKPQGWKPLTPLIIHFGAYEADLQKLKQGINERHFFLSTASYNRQGGPFYSTYYRDYISTSPEDKAAFLARIKPDADESQKWIQLELLAKYLQEFESVKVGDTRQELNKRFLNVGLTGVHTKAIYRHRECPFLVFNVEFAPAKPNQPKDSFDPNDKVTAVSKLMLEWPDGYQTPSDKEREKRKPK